MGRLVETRCPLKFSTKEKEEGKRTYEEHAQQF
jgi:hypothetical protein